MDPADLSDEALIAQVDCLARTERFTLVDFLIHLGELDKRDACEHRGFPSVFAYLTRKLGYAECDAMRRVRAARVARRFPSVRRMLASGELHIVGLAMLEPVLTSDNYRRLFYQAARKSQREIEKLAASLAPAAVEPAERIRALPASRPAERSDALGGGSGDLFQPQASLPGAAPASMGTPLSPPTETLSGRRVHFSFVADEEVERLLGQARDLLRHRFPQGRMEDLIGEALRRLVQSELPRASGRPRPSRSDPAAIARPVRTQVWNRDGGRCAYTGSDGTRCGETAWLEYDHILPRARGGKSEAGNLRLLCRAHNQAEARRWFGGAKGGFGGASAAG